MSNEMISVSRSSLEIMVHGERNLAYANARHELRALLAKPAEQHQGEPVAWRYQSHAGGLWYLSSSEHNARTFQQNGEGGEIQALYTRPAAQPQGEPVDALLLDDCVEHKHPGYGGGYFGAEVVKLYTRPAEQPAPVAVVLPERLAQILKFLEGAENLDGYWFGEPGPTSQIHWWRAELRKALEETNLFANQQ